MSQLRLRSAAARQDGVMISSVETEGTYKSKIFKMSRFAVAQCRKSIGDKRDVYPTSEALFPLSNF